MKRNPGFLPPFLITAFFCLVLLVLSLSGQLKFLSFLEKPATVIQSASYNLFQKLPFISEDLKIKRLKDDNLSLLSKIAELEKLKRENSALLDQFKTSYPAGNRLLKAEIIGAPGGFLILNKGAKDGLKIGQAVVVKDNLIGAIAKVSVNLSEVTLVSNSSLSFTAKTQTGAQGIVKGGASLTLENVLLSENIKTSELVLTKGDVNSDGVGIPQDLIVGRIISVEKSASDLFQKAKVESFVNFSKLSIVFVYFGTQ